LQSKRKLTIVVVGPTQNGKSTLCNFLVTGKTENDQEELFKSGQGVGSCTTEPFSVRFKHSIKKQIGLEETKERMFEIVCIDTPGAGDSRSNKEISNMRNLYKFIQDMDGKDTIACILFVCKYGTIIDDNYRKLVRFYYKIFENLIRRNAILVVTNVQKNDKKWLRSNNEIKNVEITINTITKEITQALTMVSDVFTVDLDCKADAESLDETHAKKVRELIFSRCSTLKGIPKKYIQFVKPLTILQQNETTIKEIEGQIKAYRNEIMEHSANKTLDTQLTELEGKIVKLEKEIDDLTTTINNYSSHEKLVTMRDTKLNATSSWKYYTYADFKETLSYPIVNIVASQGYIYNEKTKYNDQKTEVCGQVYSTFWEDLHCSLTIYTSNFHYYAVTRNILEGQKKEKEKQLEELKRNVKDLNNASSNRSEKRKELDNKIKLLEQQKCGLSKELFTTGELEEFLVVKI